MPIDPSVAIGADLGARSFSWSESDVLLYHLGIGAGSRDGDNLSPAALRYTQEHEYVKRTDDPNVVVVGITDFAQGELGDVVYVELPAAGASFAENDVFGTVEAVKAVSELFCPLAGEVVEVNERLDGEPSLVNSDPYGDGWMIKLRLSDPSVVDALMTADAYRDHVA